MKLDNLYSLRRNFTVIGLTGRTGSGCTTISKLLSGSYKNINELGLRDLRDFNQNGLFYRKYSILKKYISTGGNWVKFDRIVYSNVIILYLYNKHGNDHQYLKSLLLKYYKENKDENNTRLIAEVFLKLIELNKKYKDIISDIKGLGNIKDIKDDSKLNSLNDIFFNKQYKQFCHQLNLILIHHGYFRRTCFFHHLACNIRQTGDAINEESDGIEHIYSIAIVINRIIKARKLNNGDKPTRIVIDSLRNSLEIMFFKERYSAFYMLATKDVMENSKIRIVDRLKNVISDETERDRISDKLLNLDEVEYKTDDFSKGLFSSPDVENCIQKSDFHILNLKKEDLNQFITKYNKPPFEFESFLTREEQLLKLIALINQPGIITPSAVERCMQVANTAKLNSGCISRNVGAAITDEDFYIKSVGWNDVAKGHTPCNLRKIEDIIKPRSNSWLNKSSHYSEFEKGNVSDKSSYKYKNEVPNNFRGALKDYFENSFNKNHKDWNGKNCSFCFKTVHNHYEGEANQVHTRSLHAEENAMLQITKLGGQGVKNGILFTTASPCELCAKKAFQLGLKTIYYIDPYPGISNDQILKGGKIQNRPTMIPFSGAIGNAYHKLYDSFMAYKDEISMTLELKSNNKLGIQFKNILQSLKNKDESIKKLLIDTNSFSDEDVINLIKKGLNKQ